MTQPRLLRLGTVLTLALLATGCASLLPESKTQSAGFETFDEARQAIESLVPSVSDVNTLARMGIDPRKQPNTLILTHSDISRKVVNGSVSIKDDLDKGIVTCLNAHDACQGWELTASRIARTRTGGFWRDFLNFKRVSETTGWRFHALILMVGDLVVYRAWGGQPFVSEVEVRTNPLGPLQDSGPRLLNSVQ